MTTPTNTVARHPDAMMTDLQDAVTLAADLRVDAELATAISVTTAEVEYARSAEDRARDAFVQARAIGTKDEYLDADRAYSKARSQHLDSLARLADLKLQAGGK